MNLHRKLEIVAACSDGFAIFYNLDNTEGKLTEIGRIKADYSEPTFPCLVKFDEILRELVISY